MLYVSVKYEFLPIKCTHFTIRREIQNVNFFQATPDVRIFIIKYYFIPTLEKSSKLSYQINPFSSYEVPNKIV